MAPPLSRTWYDALVDDTGDGMTGTVWNKGQVDGLLDTVDASLAGVIANPSPVDLTIAKTRARVIMAATGAAGKARVLGYPGGGGATQGRAYLSANEDFSDAGVMTRDDLAAPASGVVCFDGNVSISQTTVAGVRTASHTFTLDGILLNTGGRIQFPTTQVASADPYTFDDYREVSWTPNLTGSGGASGQGYAVASGHATKSGNSVTCTGKFALNVLGTISGVPQIGGFPFPMKAGNHNAVGTVVFTGLTAAVASLIFWIAPGATKGDLLFLPAGGGTGYQFLTSGQLSATTEMTFAVAYQTP
jgi:hypothetical protein